MFLLPFFKCTNALFSFAINDCWGLHNCINTKIIGSKPHLHLYTSYGGKRLRVHMQNQMQFCFHFVSIAIAPDDMFDFWFLVNLKLPQHFNCTYVGRISAFGALKLKSCRGCEKSVEIVLSEKFLHAFPIPIKHSPLAFSLLNFNKIDLRCKLCESYPNR